MAEVKKVQGTDCVETVHMDMCRFGMTAVDDEGEEASAEVHQANDYFTGGCVASAQAVPKQRQEHAMQPPQTLPARRWETL